MYTPSTNDLGRGSPSSDRTSSSSPTGEEDWEVVSTHSLQPGSFSNHETTMDLTASRHQPQHRRESATSSSVIRALLSKPSPSGGNSFLTDDWEMIKGLSRLSLADSLENTPSFPHGQEQELKELKEASNESDWQYNQDIQSPPFLQETILKPRRDSPSEDGDRDSPGEYEWKNDSIGSIYVIKSVSADPFTQCFRLYPDPKASGAPSPSLSPPAEYRSSTQEQTSHPQSILPFSRPDLAAIRAKDQGTPLAKHRRSTQEQISYSRSNFSYFRPRLTAIMAANEGAPPVLAGTENRVAAFPSAVEEYLSEQKTEVDSPIDPNHGTHRA